MRTALAIGLLLATIAYNADTVSATIKNDRFEVSFSPNTSTLTVKDSKAGVTWRQCPTPLMKASEVKEEGDTLSYTLNGRYQVKVKLGDPFIDLTLSGAADTDFEPLNYPGGFILEPSVEQSLLLPNCAGFAIPFSMSEDPYLKERVAGRSYQPLVDQAGLTMPWIGTAAGEAACMTLLTTPWDGEFVVEAPPGGYTYFVQWLASKGKFAYPRTVRYYFVDKGGYVKLCKLYREHVKQEGLLVTLKDKLKDNPDIDTLVGAMSFWITDKGETSLLKEMQSLGIKEIIASYRWYPLSPPHKSVTPEFVKQAQDMGVLVGRHHEFRTFMAPIGDMVSHDDEQDSWFERVKTGYTKDWEFYNKRNAYRWFGYPEQATMNKDGKPAVGFADRGANRCSVEQLAVTQLFIPVDQDLMRYKARLIDTTVAVGLYECYSPTHPITRKEDVEYRFKQLDSVKQLGIITGTECIASWAVPAIDYAEGPPSFPRFYKPPLGVNFVLGEPTKIEEGYWKTVINEQIRAPLWQLVFHDCAVIANRWDMTPNNYNDRKAWEKDNLFDILHGQMPTYNIDRAHWETQKDMIVKSYKDVCTWNNAIGYEEMVDFKYLTPDKTVQQSIFETKNVIVNFGDNEYKASNGSVIPPKGYMIFNN